MTTVALVSVKGSPGVTTAAMSLAWWWPRPVVVLEADPAGGDLAIRLGLPPDPGLVGLAAALRRNPAADILEHYSHETPTSIRVVLAPGGSHQASAAVSVLAGMPTRCLAAEVDVLVDVGRLEPSSLTHPLVAGAGHVVWVCRPQLEDLAHLLATLEQQRHPAASIVLTGTGPYSAKEVAATLGVRVVGHLPADPSGVTALWESKSRTWTRCSLGRSARDLANDLGTMLALSEANARPAQDGDPATTQRRDP